MSELPLHEKDKHTKKHELFSLSEDLADTEAIPRHLRNYIPCPDRKEEPDLCG